jgi:cytochrome c oxidase assembly protein subunit 11
VKRLWQNNTTPILVTKLGVLVVAMFSFAIFVMPPLYDLFCEVTGLNGKTDGPYVVDTVNEQGIDTSRTIKVQFIATNNENMPWEFRPTVKTVKVHPGETTVINYFAHNPTDRKMTAQAVPSVVPFKAANYFHKTECFCFNQQPLSAGESTELGLSFIVDLDIPKQVNTITLSYTLFDITEQQEKTTNVIVESDEKLLSVFAIQ